MKTKYERRSHALDGRRVARMLKVLLVCGVLGIGMLGSNTARANGPLGLVTRDTPAPSVADESPEDADAPAAPATAVPLMSDAEETAMIMDWRERYMKLRRREVIFRNVSYVGIAFLVVGVAGLVVSRTACEDVDGRCVWRQASWGVTGTGIVVGGGALAAWITYRVLQVKHVNAVTKDMAVRVAPSASGLSIHF